jgi:hypothetical protein
MTPARANLLSMVQCRSLWIWHVWGLLVCLPPIILPLARPDFRPGAMVGMMIVPLWSGLMSASVCRDFLSRPFTFGMPRHAAVWRRTLVTVGVSVAGLCTLVFSLTHVGASGALLTSVPQALLLYLAIFFVGVLTITVASSPGALPALLTLFILIVFSDSYGTTIRSGGERAVLENPLATVLIAAAIVAGSWRMLGSRGISRMLCGKPFLAVHSMWSGNQQAIYKNALKLKRLRQSPGAVMQSLEDYFLSRMRSRPVRPTARALWGTLYMLAGRLAPARWSGLVVVAVALSALTVGLGFYHPARLPDGISAANLMMFLICAVNAEFRFNPHAALLLNISRPNRFASLIFAALVQTALVLAASAVATLLSVAAGRYLDEVTIHGYTFTYDPIVWSAILLFLPVLPFYYVCQLLFPKQSIIPVSILSAIAVVAAFANFERFLTVSPLAILIVQLACWLPFVYVVHQHCYSWDLKLEGQ